jgi:hypothetical protein
MPRRPIPNEAVRRYQILEGISSRQLAVYLGLPEAVLEHRLKNYLTPEETQEIFYAIEDIARLEHLERQEGEQLC